MHTNHLGGIVVDVPVACPIHVIVPTLQRWMEEHGVEVITDGVNPLEIMAVSYGVHAELSLQLCCLQTRDIPGEPSKVFEVAHYLERCPNISVPAWMVIHLVENWEILPDKRGTYYIIAGRSRPPSFMHRSVVPIDQLYYYVLTLSMNSGTLTLSARMQKGKDEALHISPNSYWAYCTEQTV